ncbi:TPA: phage holin, partial [Streptococcus suis]
MNKINWGVRLRNKTFLWTLVPLVVLLAQQLGFN